MTPLQAVERLRNRQTFLTSKIATMEAEGRSSFWFLKDIEAIDLAISALEYLHNVTEYEKAQQSTQ